MALMNSFFNRGQAPVAAPQPAPAQPPAFSWGQQGSTYAPGSFSTPTFGGKYAANDTWAWVTRQQWDDYMQRFAPLEEEMIGMTTYADPSVVEREVDKGTAAASGAIDNYQNMQQQYFSRYGAAIDPQVEQQTERMTNLTQSAAIADAANRIRQRLVDQNREIAFGMASSGVNPDTPQ